MSPFGKDETASLGGRGNQLRNWKGKHMDDEKTQRLLDFMRQDDLPFRWDMDEIKLNCGCYITAIHHCFGLPIVSKVVLSQCCARITMDWPFDVAHRIMVPALREGSELPSHNQGWFYTKERAIRALELLIADIDCDPWNLLYQEHETGVPIDMNKLS